MTAEKLGQSLKITCDGPGKMGNGCMEIKFVDINLDLSREERRENAREHLKKFSQWDCDGERDRGERDFCADCKSEVEVTS